MMTSGTTNVESPPDKSTVLIIGAGPVGCFLAYRLGKAGIPVTILEKESELPYTPRAVGYYGATQVAFKNAGLYELIRSAGFMTAGLCWRSLPVDDGNGGKTWGEMIAYQPLNEPGDATFPCPSGLLNLRQSELTKLLLREALGSGKVTVHFSVALEGIEQCKNGVVASAKNLETNEPLQFSASWLVGADGGKSTTRKILGLKLLGHTWPERLVSTDVRVHNQVDPGYHTCYVMDTPNPTILTPLANPVIGEKTLWRYTISVPPEDTRSDEELSKEETIKEFYEQVMVGPRPLDVDIQQVSVYRIHQRLAPTLHRKRCILAGDSAHLNNPYGAMGLNTGLLDADALAEALVMIINESRSDELLTLYSDERRKVFQYFVDPTTTANRCRLHAASTKDAVNDDYYFREIANPTFETLRKGAKPYFETWCTDIRSLASEKGL